VERLNQTIKEEFYQVAFRKRLYGTIEEIQDAFIDYYNNERTNQGRYCQGRTPFQNFLEGPEVYQQNVYEKLETEEAA
jgi:hypothetical protein